MKGDCSNRKEQKGIEAGLQKGKAQARPAVENPRHRSGGGHSDRCPVNIIMHMFDSTVAAFVGGTFWELINRDPQAKYFQGDFATVEEMIACGLDVCQRVEAESAALLMNENYALPLGEGAKVSCFSSSSVNLVYGGTGSGNIDASTADTLKTALEKSGVSVNDTLCCGHHLGCG